MVPDGAVDLLMMDALTGVLTVVLIGRLVCIGVDILVGVTANMFTGVVTEVKFAMVASLEAFSC